MTYPAFGKIPRWDKEVVLTEKIDGTNALVAVTGPEDDWPEDRSVPPRFKFANGGYAVAAGSRKRWLTPEGDSHGFARWVWDNANTLAQLGAGLHYGEWYGKGVNRSYDLDEKRFMLFNTARWDDSDIRPSHPQIEVATVLARCQAVNLSDTLSAVIEDLVVNGSRHVEGYKRPEGIVIYHTAGNNLYKVVLDKEGMTPDGYVVAPFEESAKKMIREALNDYHNPVPTTVQICSTCQAMGYASCPDHGTKVAA